MKCNLITCQHNKNGECQSPEDRKVCVDVARLVLSGEIERYEHLINNNNERLNYLRSRCAIGAEKYFDKQMYGCLSIVTVRGKG